MQNAISGGLFSNPLSNDCFLSNCKNVQRSIESIVFTCSFGSHGRLMPGKDCLNLDKNKTLSVSSSSVKLHEFCYECSEVTGTSCCPSGSRLSSGRRNLA